VHARVFSNDKSLRQSLSDLSELTHFDSSSERISLGCAHGHNVEVSDCSKSGAMLGWLVRAYGVRSFYLALSLLSEIDFWLRAIAEWTNLNRIVYSGYVSSRQFVIGYEFTFRDGYEMVLTITVGLFFAVGRISRFPNLILIGAGPS
jgi:hypothetical protein